MVDNPDMISSFSYYVLSGAVMALLGLVGYVWRSHVNQIEKLEGRINELEEKLAEHATKAELLYHTERMENLLQGIRTDLGNGFRAVNDRIDRILVGR